MKSSEVIIYFGKEVFNTPRVEIDISDSPVDCATNIRKF